jgi:hypothetical protein
LNILKIEFSRKDLPTKPCGPNSDLIPHRKSPLIEQDGMAGQHNLPAASNFSSKLFLSISNWRESGNQLQKLFRSG